MSAGELIGAAAGVGFQVAVDGVECQAYDGDSLAAVMVRAAGCPGARRATAPARVGCSAASVSARTASSS